MMAYGHFTFMHSKIRNISFTYDKFVIGSSLSALLYCFLNNIPFAYVKLEHPHRFDHFSPEQDLSFFGLENNSHTLVSPTSTKIIGSNKDILWEKLYFYLTLSGLNPVADKASSIKVGDKELKVFTHKARMAKINFEELIIFTDEGVSGLPTPTQPPQKKYKVYDWFDVRSGMKHEYDYIQDNTEFVSEILFYPTDRVDGNQVYKDAVSISCLTEKQLNSFDYSDINARFKTLKMMKGAGIRGARNGRDMLNKSRYKYYAVRIENSIREIQSLGKTLYDSTDTLKFNVDSFDDIINKNPLVESYVARIFQ
jgi:hypothetical protein